MHAECHHSQRCCICSRFQHKNVLSEGGWQIQQQVPGCTCDQGGHCSHTQRSAMCAGDGPAKGPDSEGFGPLRMWPGGLCLSRAIGDYDVGTNVLCAPHIQQVRHQLVTAWTPG